MPSTHSSSISFFGTYLSLSSLFLPLHRRVTSLIPFYSRFAPLGPGAIEPSFWRGSVSHWGERLTRIAFASFFLTGAASVCWSRVRLGHHTRAQVLAGIALGSTVAVIWLGLWLGVDGMGSLAGLNTSSVATRLPGWTSEGIKKQGAIWERAVEDAIFVGIEAWQDRTWEGLQALRKFPVVEL